MTDYAELEKRLREMADDPHNSADLTHDEASLVRDAADAISALTKQLKEARSKAIEDCAAHADSAWRLHGIYCAKGMGDDLRRRFLSRAPAEQVQGQGEK